MKHSNIVRCWFLSSALAALWLLTANAARAQSYTFSTVASFGGSNGQSPLGVLTVSGSTLYGTTQSGGANGNGTVFSVPLAGGPITTLYSFTGGADGANPLGGVIISGSTVYGTTAAGGANGSGTVFSLPIGGGSLTTLATFPGGFGGSPNGALILSGSTLYGTTFYGGAYDGGSVFSVPVSGGAITTLASFDGSTGDCPVAGLLLWDGTLFGTTSSDGVNGNGSVFSVPVSGGDVNVLYSFTGGADGGAPQCTLIGSGSTLYGTTSNSGANGDGTVFSIPATGGALTTLASFDGTNGRSPAAGLLLSGSTLFGTTYFGGAYGFYGAVFSLPVTGGAVSTLYSFNELDGSEIGSGLLLLGSTLYGAAVGGGAYGDGAIFALKPSTATSVDCSPNPSAYSTTVTINATVSPSVPDGEIVTFYSGGASIGTASTSGSVATLYVSTLTVGDNSITASYPGDANFTPSSSSAVTQTVTLAPTTMTMSSSLNPSPYGTFVTFTATVSGGVPDGEIVTFSNGDTSIGTGATAGGVATLITQSLPVGANSITATYPGDTNFATSTSSPSAQTVNPSATTTGIKSTPNPAAYGVPITFTAWIRPTPSIANNGLLPSGETVTFLDGGIAIGTGTTSNGTATLTTSALALGGHNITASYPGDTNYLPSVSASLPQTVAPIHPTTTLVSSLTPSSFGASVTFTATVSPSVPDGETVNFYDGAASKALIGSGTTTGGVATFTTSKLASGNHTIWADYVGDGNYAYSWSAGLPQIISTGTTTLVVTSSLNASTFGASVTLTATLNPSVPNGETVTYLDGTTSIGTAKTSGGKAALATAALAQGGHSITSSYPGDANYQASTSSVLTQTVNLGVTTTKLTSSPTASTYGSSVTFTATISPSVPGGEVVTFYDGSTSIGTGTTAGGKATLTSAALAVGSHSITSSYPGDANFAGSTSAVLTQTVAAFHPITTLTSSLTPSTFGSPVTFTATINTSVPDGETLNFYDGATSKALIGVGTTSGGVATFTTSKLAGGSHTIWANYVGDANYAYSWSNSLVQTIGVATTTLGLTSSLNASTLGASVTFTATLSPAVPNGETVTFLDGSTSIGIGKTSGGKATLATAALAQGSHGITASYPGDASYQTSTSSTLTQTVNQGVTTTKLTSSPNASTYGASVTFIASISPSVPGGETVTFYDGANIIGTGTISGGKATLTTAALAVGSHSITASYPGDANFGPSTSAALTQTVVVCRPTTTLSSSLNPSTSDRSVTFTATISSSVPDGETVNFYDGATSKALIGTGTTSGGVATFATTKLAKGSHTIWADYVGDANYAYSWSSGLAQTVN